MATLARTIYLDSAFGVVEELPWAGSTLENPFVFDDAARELTAMAAEGLVEIVEVRTAQSGQDEVLVDRLKFRRLR